MAGGWSASYIPRKAIPTPSMGRVNRSGSWLVAVLATLGALPCQAQQSAGYKLEETAINAAGHPEQGAIPSSPGFAITLDAVGDAVAGGGLSSPSFRMDGGFALSYPPPLEVHGLRFQDAVTLAWDAERSIGTYNLYRGGLGGLPGGYGACRESAIGPSFTTDPDTPSAGSGFFYLVTARNRLGEDGTKGFDSNAQERPTPAACP